VGTVAVVVPSVDAKDAKQVPAAADQEMVQALPAHGANPALGDGIGVGRLEALLRSR
jgi:lysyl-tRNA synthetase class II